MKANAFRASPAAPGKRPSGRVASQLRLLRELLRGDGAAYAKAVTLFADMVARKDVGEEHVHLMLQACGDEAAATALLEETAGAGFAPTGDTWRLLRAKWRVSGEAEAAARAQLELRRVEGSGAADDGGPPPAALARKRALWLRRLVSRRDAALAMATLQRYVDRGEATDPMLMIVRRAAQEDPALAALFAAAPTVVVAAAAAAAAVGAAPRPPRTVAEARAARAARSPPPPGAAATSAGTEEAPAALRSPAQVAADEAAARAVLLLQGRRLEDPDNDDEMSCCTQALEREIRSQ